MPAQAKIWRCLLDAIDAQQPAALLIVVASHGSSPAKPGAKMAITPAACSGTIGGGALEYGFVKAVHESFTAQDAKGGIFHRQHDAQAGGLASGMICGGTQTVLWHRCHALDRKPLQQLWQSERSGEALTLCLSPQGLRVVPAEAAIPPTWWAEADDWCYRETIGWQKRAYIVGAGHVGLALSQLLHTLDFQVNLLDAREDLPVQADFSHARHQRIDYAQIGAVVPAGEDVYVFIMTPGHYSDRLVLRQLIDKPLAYLGVMGSAEKLAYVLDGLSDVQRQSLHAPMGLPIHSHTPVEIAISIGAELIALANRRVER